MSWGYKITIVYCSFVAFMLFLVIKCVQQDDIHLVSEDYYEEELAFQNIIDQKANAKKIGKLTIKQGIETLNIKFPEHLKAASGEITLFRPSDAKLDIKLDFHLLKSTEVVITKMKMKKGSWTIKVHCSKAGKKYYYDRSITID